MTQQYITTFSKIHFTPLAPREQDIQIEDIAHALSFMARANGHFPEFYSVAQHSIDCAVAARAEDCNVREILACLLHDADEAYLSDITRPVKANLAEYRRIERNLQKVIYEKYIPGGPSEREEQIVKRIDDACLYYEFEHFMGEKLFEEAPKLARLPQYKVRPFREVKEAFLEMFEELSEAVWHVNNC